MMFLRRAKVRTRSDFDFKFSFSAAFQHEQHTNYVFGIIDNVMRLF